MASSPTLGPRGLLKPERTLSGRYELLGRIGSGGMAEVYLARAVGLDDFEKIVVLKRVLPERVDEPRYAAMFRDEARVAATLEHPNIVHTHDIGVTDTECFFTMEYLHGEDLKAIISAARKAEEALPLALALQIVVGCAAGLHHAHEQTDYSGRPLGIVHRDVSPSNIIVTRQSGIKLIDFGIAKAASGKQQTGVGVLKGKVAYMSPEQCRGEVLDRRSDIFALGIVLYEMITMQRPFRGNNVLGTVRTILEDQPAPPRTLRPDCPEALERIVLKAIDKQADARYQTAFEMQEELELVARDCQLLVLPGALGRYLEHLFGPKPHPWTQHAQRPPAVPRWAWSNLDSTLTSPGGDPRPAKPALPRPGAPPALAPAPARAPLGRPQATAPSQLAPHPITPTTTTPQFNEPTRAPGTDPSAPGTFAEPTELTVPPGAPVTSPSNQGLKNLMIGLAGGLIAALVVTAWPSDEPEAPPTKPAAAVTDPVAGPAPITPAAPVAAQAPTTTPVSAEIPQTNPDPGERPSSPSTPDDTPLAGSSSETPSIDDADSSRGSSGRDSARATRLLDRARTNLMSSPKQAHRDAKAAYDLKPTQAALRLMGFAACRLKSESKARFAYRRLRGQARDAMESSCLKVGIDLR